ncbi:hypothetical protein LCGC14_1624650 [marine sediment metagenome]|uniref:Uncharacterized protein n=1 Tax=marine sediment metagenome TaxID=412755 RepID=A0A0F9KK38_9ZZZZ
MKKQECTQEGIGSGTYRGIWEESDDRFGRRKCYECNRIIRVGQEVEACHSPRPFYRETKHSYKHYPICPISQATIKNIERGE